MTEALRYPTGVPLLDELVEFGAARLSAIHKPDMTRRASLDEDHWVADHLAEHRSAPLPKLSPEEGLRFIYRFARDRNVLTGLTEGRWCPNAPDLLLHQLTELLPAMFGAARDIHAEQAEARPATQLGLVA